MLLQEQIKQESCVKNEVTHLARSLGAGMMSSGGLEFILPSPPRDLSLQDGEGLGRVRLDLPTESGFAETRVFP